jgi:hypothetical protein
MRSFIVWKWSIARTIHQQEAWGSSCRSQARRIGYALIWRETLAPIERFFEAVEYATLERVDWFNSCLRWSPSGTSRQPTPGPKFYAAVETEPIAA